jgi:FtsP/CotA-like multicopper oxidase with cupredoxin domain
MKTHTVTCLKSALFILLAMLLALSLTAQTVPCPPLNPDFVKVPELVSKDGKLRGTVRVVAQQESIATRIPPSVASSTSTFDCYPQWVRVMTGDGALPPAPVTPAGSYPFPLPGPTLRLRVGELVELTLLNLIDANKFPYSVDRGDTDPGGCDQTSVYPKSGPVNDVYPDCFHGSSTVNMHFHGTHTNPNTTGDNVFLEIRPSMRTKDQANAPLVTGASVAKPFNEFFERCEGELTTANQVKQWPRTWKDFPDEYTNEQKRLLKLYDLTPGIKKLWPVDAAQLAKQDWPQYYMGAYPYCFRIPEYTAATWPPPATSVTSGGMGAAEHDAMAMPRPLRMGQAPGTHWYHAHKHGSTAIDVANGMTGAIIIEGGYDDYLNSQYGAGWTRKQPVMVINQIGTAPNLERGGGTPPPDAKIKTQWKGQDKGPDFSVNGRLSSVVKMYPGEVQLWRIVNTSGRAGTFFVGPPSGGFEWRQLAQDGVQFSDTNYTSGRFWNKSFLLMPGNRADLLVKAPATLTAGATLYPVLVQNEVDPSDLASAYPVTLVNIRIDGSGTEMKFIDHAAPFPPFLQDIADNEVRGTKEIVFGSEFPAGGPPSSKHTIDGKQFDGEVGEVVLLNTVEEWKVSNATYVTATGGAPISHPFHIHINPFQVREIFSPGMTIPNPTTTNPKATAPLYIFDETARVLPAQCYLDPQNPSSWKPCANEPQPPAINPLWWDVFPIPSGVAATNAGGNPIMKTGTNTQVLVPGYFRMRSRFVDYSGYYVIHCHILAHEDRGMMTIVEVAPRQSPYSHH